MERDLNKEDESICFTKGCNNKRTVWGCGAVDDTCKDCSKKAQEEINQVIDELEMNDEICIKCARCCYLTKKLGRFYITTKEACPYLDHETKLCKIYEGRLDTRTNKENICFNSKDSFSCGFLPKGCPYIKYYEKELGRKYRSKLLEVKKK